MLIYAPNGAVVAGLTGHYRNPDYFEQATPTDKVLLVGDYPHIEQAFTAIGVPVEHLPLAEPVHELAESQVEPEQPQDEPEQAEKPDDEPDEKPKTTSKTKAAK